MRRSASAVAAAFRRRRSAPLATLARWGGEDSLKHLAAKPQTGVSLRGLVEAGQNHLKLIGASDPSECTPVLLNIAGFLHHELPIRYTLEAAPSLALARRRRPPPPPPPPPPPSRP